MFLKKFSDFRIEGENKLSINKKQRHSFHIENKQQLFFLKIRNLNENF